MRQRGVLVAQGIPLGTSGEHVDHIQISPPFTISDGEITQIVETLDDVLRDIPVK